MSNRLQGQVVAITGGNQGIGLGIAQRFVEEGAAVSICYLSDKPGTEKVAESLRANGAKAVAIQADVSKLADGQRFVAETARQLGVKKFIQISTFTVDDAVTSNTRCHQRFSG